MSPTFVVGYDASPSADAALRQTIARARERNGDVVAVFGYYITPWGGTGEGSIREAMESVGADALEQAMSALDDAGIPATKRLVEGKPADAVLVRFRRSTRARHSELVAEDRSDAVDT